jgi:hypothetical protein
MLIAVLGILSVAGCSVGGGADNATKYTVIYNGNGNTGGGNIPVDSETYLQDATVIVLGNTGTLVNAGYTFAGWNTQPGNSGTSYASGDSFTMGTSDMTLFAVWMKPAVVSTSPAGSESGVAINSSVSATFNEAMDATTMTSSNFQISGSVTGTIVYDAASKTVTFAPASNLAASTPYTATLTTGVKDIGANPMAAAYLWSFTTASAGTGPAPVNLRTSGNYVILAKTEITNVPPSAITGKIGLSPAAESFITGFSQTDKIGYATSAQVTGFLYAASMASPTPAALTTAISDMQTAYTDAAGRPSGTGANLNLGAGTIGAITLAPGTYTWGTGLTIGGNITISGGANDTWIFQIAGDLIVRNGVKITLSGGAQAKNIVWQLSGQATLGTTSQFKGILLSQTAINLQTGATMNGRALAQSGVTLQSNAIVAP